MNRALFMTLAFAVFPPLSLSEGSSVTGVLTDDGRHRVAYVLDSATGKLLFAEDLSLSEFGLPGSMGAPLAQMLLVATVPTPSFTVLSTQVGFDLDQRVCQS